MCNMQKHYSSGITLTMTTCKRISMFMKTVNSLFKHCKDSHLIKRFVISDDRSSDVDRKLMRDTFPHFEFYNNDGGQPQSVDFLFNIVNTEYTFHLEDDRMMIHDMDLMGISIKILRECNVDSFISGCQIGLKTDKVCTLRDYDWDYYIHEHQPDENFWSDWGYGNKSWPGFYLAAGLHRTAAIQSIPYQAIPQHERSYALKYWKEGYRVAFNCGPAIFEHIGYNCSSYDLTNSAR